MFRNRLDAGERLAGLLERRGVEADLVLAVPRGGLPVGRAVADALGLPLDVVVARKLGAPHNPELAIGAVAADGTVWLNDRLIDDLGLAEETVDRLRREEAENARRKAERYRRGRPQRPVAGQRVIVVDDGVATGATITACLRSVRRMGATAVVLAVPVGPSEALDRLGTEADDVVCVDTPSSFGAVGSHYADFAQVTDEEALGYLDGSPGTGSTD